MENAIVIRSSYRIFNLIILLCFFVLGFYFCYNFLSFFVGSFNINDGVESVTFKVKNCRINLIDHDIIEPKLGILS
jgi:hypothetical protein